MTIERITDQRSKVKGQRSKGKGQRAKVKGQREVFVGRIFRCGPANVPRSKRPGLRYGVGWVRACGVSEKGRPRASRLPLATADGSKRVSETSSCASAGPCAADMAGASAIVPRNLVSDGARFCRVTY